MKQLFRNIFTLSVLLVYSLGNVISIQQVVSNSVSSVEKHQGDTVKDSDATKALVSYLYSNKGFIDSVFNDFSFDFNFETEDFKTSFSALKHKEPYTQNKVNTYLNYSKHIQPGLSIKALLYPFHTFS
ncbi:MULTISPECIES: hypothetical protein [Hwangdonia]|uniref:Uncharacterized protein n=1 Tax=Hwangdonia seohaensis TaxID=1240727 RepID=A0ABW3RDG1_9FLAO|nr:hypothetical protein [Hwangdonia seohaensis]